MILLLPPKYRYYYWGCALTGGAIIIGLLALAMLLDGNFFAFLFLAVWDAVIIITVRHVFRKITEIRAEENQEPPTESTFLNES